MNKSIAKLFLFLSLAASMGALPAMAQAKNGADDAPQVQLEDGPGHL